LTQKGNNLRSRRRIDESGIVLRTSVRRNVLQVATKGSLGLGWTDVLDQLMGHEEHPATGIPPKLGRIARDPPAPDDSGETLMIELRYLLVGYHSGIEDEEARWRVIWL
jgi:hypothetical protein